ncbi:hypothetical protein FACS1894180_1490 [Bacteroidia bacterium]|nr:hypothetical protein FACS1894180_1490 [Bacteroidia bacterium]
MKTTLIMFYLLVSLSVYSQVRYGIEAGYIVNNVDAINVESKTKPSLRIGGFVRYDNNIETGIYFSRKGMSLTGFAPQYADKIEKINFYGNYIELVPFSADLVSNQKLIFDKLTWNFNVGFYVSYSLGAKGNVVIANENLELNNIYKDTELIINGEKYIFKAFNPFDFGTSVGFKFLLYDKFFIRAYTSLSFINMTKYDKKIQYNSICLSVGYMFQN